MLQVEPDAKPGDDVVVRLSLPKRKKEESYLKVFVTGGTIARRAGQLVTHSKAAGEIEIEAFMVEPGEALAATSTIIVR